MDIIYRHNTPYHNTLNTHWSYFLLLTGCWRYSGHCLHLMWMISTFYNFYISPHGCNALSHIKDVFCLNVMCTAVLHLYCNKDVLNAVSAHSKQATPLLAKFRKECAMSTLYALFTSVVPGKHRTLQFHRYLILNRQCLMLSQRIGGRRFINFVNFAL